MFQHPVAYDMPIVDQSKIDENKNPMWNPSQLKLILKVNGGIKENESISKTQLNGWALYKW